MLKKCKYLLLLFVGLFGFIGFSNAGTYTYTGHVSVENSNNVNTLFSFPVPATAIPYNGDTYINCSVSNFSGDCNSLRVGFGGANSRIDGTWNNVTVKSDVYLCVDGANFKLNNQRLAGIRVYSSVSSLSFEFDWSCTINGDDIITLSSSSCPECEQCPEIDTGSILSGSCDINYCVENGLCPTGTGSRSELVINNIVHEGKPLININIPDYIQWDYAVDENQYDIYVGSGYDQDYIDSVLKINSYRPDNKDFTQVFVSGLTLIFPYIFVALLIVFIWKLLKRIFR